MNCLVFVYNTGLLPVAAGTLVPIMIVSIFGWLTIIAGLAMAMSPVTVVTNFLLLGKYTLRKRNT
ncbi:hypothetical protein NARC_50124 [Candidatus Nitrosocosmicus arcticus]|uniref:Uncharacterized protein n=1 Tax=Candidatus Nitrosocosmicus arcticus TaxID=2035267 RepID=A0A557SWG5_9ARCH|nr:hypothetical protein NARC_50124 [Candidatus Nitrosocosmicus arcticus]